MRDRGFPQAVKGCVAFVGQLDALYAPVGGVSSPGDQAVALERVEMVGQGRAADAHRLGEVKRQSRDFSAALEESSHPSALLVLPHKNHFEVAAELSPGGLLARAALVQMGLGC